MLKCFPNISREKIVSLRATGGSSWFEVYDPGADQWRLWKMLQSCLMDDGEFHSHCCASRRLLLFLLLPPCCSLTLLRLLSFFIRSFNNNLLCHPGLLMNSAGVHSRSIQLIQLIFFKNLDGKQIFFSIFSHRCDHKHWSTGECRAEFPLCRSIKYYLKQILIVIAIWTWTWSTMILMFKIHAPLIKNTAAYQDAQAAHGLYGRSLWEPSSPEYRSNTSLSLTERRWRGTLFKVLFRYKDLYNSRTVSTTWRWKQHSVDWQ